MSWFSDKRLIEAEERQADAFEQSFIALSGIYAALVGCSATLNEIRFCLGRPGPVRLLYTQEENGMFTFKIVFPKELDQTAVTRELSVTVGDQPDKVLTFPADAAETAADAFSGKLGDSVHAELVDLDGSGNRSESSILDAVIVDTFPPQKPGEMGTLGVEWGVKYLKNKKTVKVPKKVIPGFEFFTKANVDDPKMQQFIYQ